MIPRASDMRLLAKDIKRISEEIQQMAMYGDTWLLTHVSADVRPELERRGYTVTMVEGKTDARVSWDDVSMEVL